MTKTKEPKGMEIMLPAESKPEAQELMEFLHTLTEDEQGGMSDFFQGAKWMRDRMTRSRRGA